MENKAAEIITVIIGAALFVLSILVKGKFDFLIGGMGFALAGIGIELYIKDKNDIKTKDGKSRMEIAEHDERTVLVNARSGETVNYIMTTFTLIAFILACSLNVSFKGRIIILSLIIIRLIATPIVKYYYENNL